MDLYCLYQPSGRAFDVYIAKNSVFLKYLLTVDELTTDCGFMFNEDLRAHRIKLKIPVFNK